MRDRTTPVDGGQGGEDDRLRKVFIVARGRPDLYASLSRALASEQDVLVIYDRRGASPPSRRGLRSLWSMTGEGFRVDDRRVSNIDEEIRLRGFGVVHLDDDAWYDDVPDEHPRAGYDDGEDEDYR